MAGTALGGPGTARRPPTAGSEAPDDGSGEDEVQFKAPKGTMDLLPEKAAKWRYLDQLAGWICERYGYRPVVNPIFEQTELFARGIGSATDIVQKEMYTFTDKGGRSLTLRPEGTAPVMRAYLEHGMGQLPQPVKLYYYGPMFRQERPQAGRYRQFFQVGAELIGSDTPEADAEVIALLMDYFRAVGLKELELQINSMGDQVCRPAYVEALKQHVLPLTERLCPDCAKRLDTNPLRLFDCKNPGCKEVLVEAPKLLDYLDEDCRSHFERVQELLKAIGLDYKINPRLVRGLDYYTRTTFEVVSPRLGAQNAIGGGGRYDRLIEELGGPPTPATGFALGVDRLVLAADAEGVDLPVDTRLAVFVAYASEEAVPASFKLVSRLRAAALAADMDYTGRSLKAQVKYADKLGAVFTVFLGPDELAKQSALIRDMKSGDQVEVPLVGVIDWVKTRLG